MEYIINKKYFVLNLVIYTAFFWMNDFSLSAWTSDVIRFFCTLCDTNSILHFNFFFNFLLNFKCIDISKLVMSNVMQSKYRFNQTIYYNRIDNFYCTWCINLQNTEKNSVHEPLNTLYPASILNKSTVSRYRPVSYPDGSITACYRFM